MFSDVNNFSAVFKSTNLAAVPPNYLNVTLDELYVYDSLQSGVDTTKTSNGKKDAISLLYSQEEVDQYVTYPLDDQNGYKILSNANADDMTGPTWTLKMLIAGTFETVYSAGVGDNIMTEFSFANEKL